MKHPWLLLGGSALVLFWLVRRSTPARTVGPANVGPTSLGTGAAGSGASSPQPQPGQGAQGGPPAATMTTEGGVTTIGPVTPSGVQ